MSHDIFDLYMAAALQGCAFPGADAKDVAAAARAVAEAAMAERERHMAEAPVEAAKRPLGFRCQRCGSRLDLGHSAWCTLA